MHADNNLIQCRIVINSVHMVSVGQGAGAGVVYIHQFGMVGRVGHIIVLGRIIALTHVIPEIPFPDNGACCCTGGFYLNNPFRIKGRCG
ncbi:hypothetical protein DSECCO2_649090 [anaerobic digester metagenome]